MQKAVDYLKGKLKEDKLRWTKQREAIVRMFLAKEGHICIDELYSALRNKFKNIGYTTVYRTFKLLKSAGMAWEVNFSGKRKRFEHSFEHPHHDHFVCEKCGKVIEFFDQKIEERQDRLCQKYGFKGSRHFLQIFGLCKKCG